METSLKFVFSAMHATNSDMIQPGLLQLQPNVEDDYMDFDPFQGKLVLVKTDICIQ